MDASSGCFPYWGSRPGTNSKGRRLSSTFVADSSSSCCQPSIHLSHLTLRRIIKWIEHDPSARVPYQGQARCQAAMTAASTSSKARFTRGYKNARTRLEKDCGDRRHGSRKFLPIRSGSATFQALLSGKCFQPDSGPTHLPGPITTRNPCAMSLREFFGNSYHPSPMRRGLIAMGNWLIALESCGVIHARTASSSSL